MISSLMEKKANLERLNEIDWWEDE